MNNRQIIFRISLLAAIWASTFAAAEEFSIVFPNGFEHVEGNDGDGVGTVIAQSGMRYQQVFDASQFAAVPVTQRLIKAQVFRPDGLIGFRFSTTTPNYTLRLSTTDKAPGQLSTVFDDNVGTDQIIVFEGDNILSTDNSGMAGGPKEFDMRTDFHTPFFYDPSLGNLLLDLTIHSQVLSSGLDFHDSQANVSITQFMFSPDPNGMFATTQGVRTPVEKFAFADPGDYNADGIFNCEDIDDLVAEVAAGTDNPFFDITGDNLVNLDDRNAWLAAAGALNLPSGNPHLVGDANLDGVVDGLDFIEWNNNKFTSAAAWCAGDFNADGIVDGQDFIEWNNNKFQSANGVSAVPEPGAAAVLWTAIIASVVVLRNLPCQTNRIANLRRAPGT